LRGPFGLGKPRDGNAFSGKPVARMRV